MCFNLRCTVSACSAALLPFAVVIAFYKKKKNKKERNADMSCTYCEQHFYNYCHKGND